MSDSAVKTPGASQGEAKPQGQPKPGPAKPKGPPTSFGELKQAREAAPDPKTPRVRVPTASQQVGPDGVLPPMNERNTIKSRSTGERVRLPAAHIFDWQTTHKVGGTIRYREGKDQSYVRDKALVGSCVDSDDEAAAEYAKRHGCIALRAEQPTVAEGEPPVEFIAYAMVRPADVTPFEKAPASTDEALKVARDKGLVVVIDLKGDAAMAPRDWVHPVQVFPCWAK